MPIPSTGTSIRRCYDAAMSDSQSSGVREPDVSALATPALVRVASGFQAVSGLYLALAAVQSLVSVRFYGDLMLVQYANWALLVLGVGQILAAAKVYRLVAPYGVLATILAATVALAVTGWLVLNVYLAIFSCMQIGALIFAWIAAVLAPWTIGPVRAADAARRALARDGMDIGF